MAAKFRQQKGILAVGRSVMGLMMVAFGLASANAAGDFDKNALDLISKLIRNDGYNCPEAVGGIRLPNNQYGMPATIYCTTGKFSVTITPQQRVIVLPLPN